MRIVQNAFDIIKYIAIKLMSLVPTVLVLICSSSLTQCAVFAFMFVCVVSCSFLFTRDFLPDTGIILWEDEGRMQRVLNDL